MALRNYGDFIVHGGQVHAGDTIVNFNISGELTETAHSCQSIDATLAGLLDPQACLGDIKSDIEEIRNVIDIMQACIDGDSQNEALMSTKAQSYLSDLWIACKRHRQTLAIFETMIKTSTPELSSTHAHVKYASLRSALQSLRVRLNTSLAVLHLSTLQSVSSASEQHCSQFQRRIESLQEQYTTNLLTRLPKTLPASSTNLPHLQPIQGFTSVVHDLLQTKHTTLRFNENKMQHINSGLSSKNVIAFLPLFQNAIRPIKRLTSNTTPAAASLDIATFRTSARGSSSRRPQWISRDLHLTSTHDATSNALTSLRNHLDDRTHTVLQIQSNRPCRDDVSSARLNDQGILRQSGVGALPIFAELTQVVVIAAVVEMILHIGR